MIRFVIVLAIIVGVVGVAYYYMSVKEGHEIVKQQTEAALQAHLNTKIPPGAVMEDGTVGE